MREKIAGYFNDVVGMGVRGFRVDASKHMWPGDLDAMLGMTQDVNGGGRPLFFHEVIDMGGEAISANEYTGVGKVTEFRWAKQKDYRIYEATFFEVRSQDGAVHQGWRLQLSVWHLRPGDGSNRKTGRNMIKLNPDLLELIANARIMIINRLHIVRYHLQKDLVTIRDY